MKPKNKITFEEFVKSVFEEINKIYDYDFNERLIPRWTKKYEDVLRWEYDDSTKPYDTAIILLDEAKPRWRKQVYGD